MDIEEFNKKDILGDFEYELNKLCRSCIGTATEIKIKQQPLINLFEKIVWFYEKEKKKNKELSEHADNLLGEKEHYQDCYDGITFKINNLISQIENAIDFIKTDKSKIKVDMYQQKEEDLKLEIVHLKKLLKEE